MSTADIQNIASTSQQTRLALLRSLAESDGFRAQLERNPAAALAPFGLKIDAEQIPDHISLPEKEAVHQSLEHLPETWKTIGSLVDRAWGGFIGNA